MSLSNKEFNVIVSRLMFKSDYKSAIEWLEKEKQISMSETTYHRILNKLDSESFQRLSEIGKNFPSIMVDEITKFENFEKEIMTQYEREKNPMNKAKIIMMNAQLQPFIISLLDQSKTLLEARAVESIKEDNILSKFTKRNNS